MAEFPSLGEHCDFESCNDLDFLPFQCRFCKGVYCKKHKSCDAHCCAQFSLHSASKSAASEASELVNDGVASFSCSVEACNRRELTEIRCKFCKNLLCMKHRFPSDHGCSVYNVNLKGEKVDRKVVEVKEFVQKRQPLTEKSKETACRLAVMKMRMKAIGEKSLIPEASRVYFSIQLPNGYKYSGDSVAPKWSVGRCIDSVSKLVDLPNENNKMAGKKLHMRRKDAESADFFKWDSTLADLLKQTLLTNGCELMLIYD